MIILIVASYVNFSVCKVRPTLQTLVKTKSAMRESTIANYETYFTGRSKFVIIETGTLVLTELQLVHWYLQSYSWYTGI